MRDWPKEVYLCLRGVLLRPFYPAAEKTPDLSSVKTILVLRYDRIGDMVQTTPLLRALREEFPNAEISVLASQSNADVLRGNPYLNRAFVLPLRGCGAFMAQMNRLHFDLIIDPYLSYDLTWGRMAAKIPGRYRLGLDLYGRGIFYNIRVSAPLPPLSAAEATLEICRRGLKRPFKSREPEIFLQNEEISGARKMLEAAGLSAGHPLVLLHPGGYYAEQRWPAERFARVAVELEKSKDCAAALIGGPQDEPLLARATCFEPSAKALRTVSLRQLMAALSHARLLICNNSGPLHLACALKLPTISTLGPTDRVLFSPRGSEHRVLERHPLDQLRVDEVLREAQSLLAPLPSPSTGGER